MPHEQVSRSSNSINILVIDDEESQIELIKLNLERLDPSFKIITTTKSSSVVGIISEQHVDCIVSDYKLGPVNGLQLCKEIKKTSKIPFILYTARGSEEVAEDAFNVGVDDYLRKEETLAHFRLLTRGLNILSMSGGMRRN